jgi:hypothetical protein
MIGTPISMLSHGFGRACHAASAIATTQSSCMPDGAPVRKEPLSVDTIEVDRARVAYS